MTDNIIDNKNIEKKTEKEIISKAKLLEAGVYFGSRKSQWNPKMKPYILTSKKGTHIIDIQKTKKTLEFAYSMLNKFASRGATFIFVGTRKQAQSTVKENALRTNSFYVSERWLGGTLTNNKTIFNSVKKMLHLERLAESDFEDYTKKEGVLFKRELAKLKKNLDGIKNMKTAPQIMIVADPKHDIIAVKEAKKLGVKVIGIVDTNVDPTLVDIAIPANDDSIKSVTLILTILADAIVAAKGGKQLYAFQEDDVIVLPQELASEKKDIRKPRRFSSSYSDNRSQSDQPQERRYSENRFSDKPREKHFTPKQEDKVESQDSSSVQQTQVDLKSLKLAELKQLAKEKGLQHYSTLKKDELIEALS